MICETKSYDWGNKDPRSLLRTLAQKGGHKIPAEGEPLAELWMGDHPGGPSTIYGEDRTLQELIQKEPENDSGAFHQGSPPQEKNHSGLPFLFKVLDAKKTLSIQAHPDRKLARELHRKDPEHYPDSNHKPEMVIALSGVRAMVGFRPGQEILSFLDGSKTLMALMSGDQASGEFSIERTFSRLMNAGPKEIKSAVESFQTEPPLDSLADEVFRKLLEQYGNEDPGIFAPYLLNVLEPRSGEALFLGPGVPHAYIQGEMIECMASSDNVVRAGLTKKFRDLPVLLSMLDCSQKKELIIQPHRQQHSGSGEPIIDSYPVLTSEFQIHRISTQKPGTLIPPEGFFFPGILLILQGQCEIYASNNPHGSGDFSLIAREGEVIFFPEFLNSRNNQDQSFQWKMGANSIFFLATVGQIQ